MTMANRLGKAWARIGWLAITLMLALALVVGSWVNYRGAQSAVDTLNTGQKELLETAVRAAFPPWDTITDAALEEFVASRAGAGLRYVGIMDRTGEVTYSAGEPAGPLTLPTFEPGPPGATRLEAVGERIRFSILNVGGGGGPGGGRGRGGPPPTTTGDSAGRQFDGDAPNGPTGNQAAASTQNGQGFGAGEQPDSAGARQGFGRNFGGGGFNRGTVTLVEFVPAASGLVQRAETSVWLAWIGATILALAAFLFWRTSEGYEQARTHLEEQRRLSVLGEMSAVLAHEIRNPLASLKGTAQLLAEKLTPASKERVRADRIIHEAVRLEALTSDLLHFARTGPIERQPTDPVELMRNSIAEVDEDGFVLDVSSAPERWTMDGGRVRHVLVNVLMNAQQASPEGTPPRVRVAKDRNDLVYEVRDFGKGLAEGTEERIFDPFFTTRTNGTGLGLAVAKRVVEMHGGEITARNHPDGGAVFRVKLPA